MRSIDSLIAKSAIVLALTPACSSDPEGQHIEYADAATNDIAAGILSRAGDASKIQSDSAKSTCPTFEELTSQGACSFDMAKSDADTVNDTASVLKMLEDQLSTAFKGITPTIKIGGSTQTADQIKTITFVNGPNKLQLETVKEVVGVKDAHNTQYYLTIFDNNAIKQQIIWVESVDHKHTLSCIVSLEDTCNNTVFHQIANEQLYFGEKNTIKSRSMRQLWHDKCQPLQQQSSCGSNGTLMETYCNGSNTPAVIEFSQESKDESKLDTSSMQLQQYKKLMSTHGVDVEL